MPVTFKAAFRLIQNGLKRLLPPSPEDRCRYATSKIVKATNCTVIAGPFQGMKYLRTSLGSVFAAKLLGTYENELHPWINTLQTRGYTRIHDIGCAEGYYVVGLARLVPNSVVYGYDLDPASSKFLAELASLNDVAQRVAFRGVFTCDAIDDAQTPTLVICDIEGEEARLLDPAVCPKLRSVDLLVEVHDGTGSDIENTLRSRFEPTHTITSTHYRGRTQDDLPAHLRKHVHTSVQKVLVDEQRKYGLKWLLMVRRV